MCLVDFNPRPLAGATGRARMTADRRVISIHAPLRGRPNHTPYLVKSLYFNPRPLAGATKDLEAFAEWAKFQSTPPCGGDIYAIKYMRCEIISIHAPLRGRPG